ncbi:hypothetical protein [Actinacidiphila acididurans]|uniref:PBP domain-containing protein n=1 Tax=Actinacidiphila acididurans TaxID=2784346 RepID=A0ABS2TMN2_9ACTN|nr:hypothetical protein [Actinacidiphila acididurans]MBM9504610.1 hypothetical protein [Actinacidiphila acididurans]
MNVKFAKRAAIIVGTASLSVAMVAGAAQADPPAGVHRTLVAVGSDTTQDVLNGLGNTIADPNPTGTSDGNLIASYDATGTTPIQTRDSGCSIARPDGSGAGVNALKADIAAGTHCIDFARSSSAPNATGSLTFIPFALDGVTLAVGTGSTLPANVTYTAGATTNAAKAASDLNRVYNCLDTAGNPLPAGTFPTINGITVHPLVPQAGSGTRKFWASTLGFNATTLPSCVSDVAKNGAAVQEHNGNALQRTVAVDHAEDIMPFSIAQWIAQSNHATTGVTDRRNGAVLENVNSVAPTTSGKLNTSFPITREVYNVIPDSRINETLIKNTFETSTSKICKATSVINLYGFGTDTNCGSIALSSRDLV